MWDEAKAVLRGKFIATNVYIKKQEGFQINKLTLFLKEIAKEEQTKPKVSRRNETIKQEKVETIRIENEEIKLSLFVMTGSYS